MNLHVFDIDRTIAEDTYGISDKMVKQLLELKEHSMVWFATGRGFLSAKKGLLNLEKLMEDSRIAVENGTKIFINNQPVFDFEYLSEDQITQIVKFITNNADDFKMGHFWSEGKLLTFVKTDSDFPYTKNEFAVKTNDIDEFLNEVKTAKPTMIHLRFGEAHTPPNIKFYNHKSYYTFMPTGTSKANIFHNLPAEIKEVFIYGDGANDVEMFNAKLPSSIKKTLHSVGNNQALVEIADVKLKDPADLADYLADINIKFR